jgi:transposase
MQGVERADRELLDARALVGHLVPTGSMFAFLADHRQDVFDDKEFGDLFPSGKGRPSIPASVMASILVLQTLHDLSDRETAEAARCDLRWKVATGMALDHKGFDPSTLVYWRKRLAKSTRPQRINEAVRQVVEETGILRGRRKRAVDSTILADAVATQDTITQLIAAIRRVGRVVPGGSEAITAVCTGHDYHRPGKPVIDWDEPGAKDTLVSALVNDANALLAVFAEVDQDELAESVRAALALLALVAGQDVEPRRRIRRHRWAVAHRPQGRSRSGDLDGGPGGAAYPQVTRGAPGRVSGACGGRAGDGDHHRRSAHQGRRDAELRSGCGGEVPGRR